MQFNQFFGQCQSDSRACISVFFIHPVIPVKNTIEMFRCNALSGVGYTNLRQFTGFVLSVAFNRNNR